MIEVGIGTVIVNLAITAVVTMIDLHTVVVLPQAVTMDATTDPHRQDGEEALLVPWVLPVLVWDTLDAFLVISLDFIPVVKVESVRKNVEEGVVSCCAQKYYFCISHCFGYL